MTEREELLKLRALLAEKERIIEEKNQLIEKQKVQIDNMTQALLHARKKRFGASSALSINIWPSTSLGNSLRIKQTGKGWPGFFFQPHQPSGS